MATGWGATKTKQRDADWRDNFDQGVFTDGQFVTVRPIGPVNSFAQHWVEFTGKDGKKKTFPVTCRNWNSEKEEFESNGCPACKRQIKAQVRHFGNFISRELQEEMPKKAVIETATKTKKFRAPTDKSWSPVRVYILPSTAVDGLKDVYALNKHKIKNPETGEVEVVACDPNDPHYGCDVRVKYDSNKDGSNKYNVQKGDHAPLTDDEKTYMLYDLNVIFYPEKDALEAKLQGFEDKSKKGTRSSIMDEDEDTDMPPPRSKRSKIADDDEDMPAPRKKAKAPVEVDEDDEEEEKPRKKTKALPPSDDEEEEKPRKKKPMGTRSEEEEEDEDEEPRPVSKKKKPVDEDDEEEHERKSCYGTYVGKAKCWECDDREACVDKKAETEDEDE